MKLDPDLLVNLDPGFQPRLVRHRPLMAYEGYWDEMQSEEPAPLSEDDLKEISGSYHIRRTPDCVICGAPVVRSKRGARRVTCGTKCALVNQTNLRQQTYYIDHPVRECPICHTFHQRRFTTCSPKCMEVQRSKEREERERQNEERRARLTKPKACPVCKDMFTGDFDECSYDCHLTHLRQVKAADEALRALWAWDAARLSLDLAFDCMWPGDAKFVFWPMATVERWIKEGNKPAEACFDASTGTVVLLTKTIPCLL